MEFNSKEEENYYELIIDMLDDGTIEESERSLLNKRKDKYGISDERAKEFEDYIKSIKGINNTVSYISNISNKENADDLLEQGKAYFNDENYEEAIKCLNKAGALIIIFCLFILIIVLLFLLYSNLLIH